MKTCKICKVEFPKTLEFFCKNGKYLKSYCKNCTYKLHAEWQKANPEKHRANNKAYRIANPEKEKAGQKAWRDKNSEKVKAKSKAWSLANPEKRRGYNNKYRAVKLGNEHSPYTETEMLERYGTVCYLCNEEIDLKAPRSLSALGHEKSFWRDHVVALTNGGPDILDNVKPSHAICNKLKGNKEIYEN